MASRKLDIASINKMEVWHNGDCIERQTIWEGVNQDGVKVRVYITKIEELPDETEDDQ